MGNQAVKEASKDIKHKLKKNSQHSSLRYIVRESQNHESEMNDNVNVFQNVNQSSIETKRRRPKLLCLHGWRTNPDILEMQTAALRYHTLVDCVIVEAPYEAVGPPDEGIAMFYPGRQYYEWFLKDPSVNINDNESLRHSLALLQEFCVNHGPFDGILGFSQGGQMTTRLVYKLLQQAQSQSQSQTHAKANTNVNATSLFKFVILIGGTTPIELEEAMKSGIAEPLKVPSLHIYGTNDPYMENSKRLLELYWNGPEEEKKHVPEKHVPDAVSQGGESREEKAKDDNDRYAIDNKDNSSSGNSSDSNVISSSDVDNSSGGSIIDTSNSNNENQHKGKEDGIGIDKVIDKVIDKDTSMDKLEGLKYKTCLVHDEGHNIPSIRTGIYPIIKDFIFHYTHSS